MKKLTSILMILFGMVFSGFSQKDNLDIYPSWVYYGDMSNSMYQQLCHIGFGQIDRRRAHVAGLTTKEDWEQRRKEVKGKLEKIIGVFPEKTPLNPVVTGTIKKEDYTVEKLYFESLPGYHVTAGLFLPSKGKGKKPVIIYCCGHSSNGFRSEAYQKVIINYVKKGFVVLAFDPVGQGERAQYFAEDGSRIFPNPCHEHSYPGTQAFISGLSPAWYFIWDGIRAVDYLTGRKEVDAGRIGITGRSGGGTQSAYIAAMDERIAAAAPECYITTSDMLLRSIGPQDAEQIFIHALAEGIDMSDLIEVRAPKPAMIISTTGDFFSIQGARDVFSEAKRAYSAWGYPGNIEMSEDDAGHASTKKNREAAYAFFRKHLNNPGSPADEEVEIFDEKELWVTPNGQLQGFIPTETLYSLNRKHAGKILDKVQAKRENDPDFLKTLSEKVIRVSGYKKTQPSTEYIFTGRIRREGYTVEKYLVKGATGHYIPLLRLLPGRHSKGTILLLDDKGKAFSVNEGLAGQLVRKGYEVMVPDLSGTGELSIRFKEGDSEIRGVALNVWYAGILTHKSHVAVRMEEIDCMAGFIREINSQPVKITAVACGTLGSDLLHSAVVENHFDKIVLVNPLYSFTSIVGEKNYDPRFAMSAMAGVLEEYDLPDLVSACAPGKIRMVNPVSAIDAGVDATEFDPVYARVRENYSKTGKPANFTVDFNRSDPLSGILQWMD